MEYSLQQWDKSWIPSLARNANDERIARYLGDAFPIPYTEEAAKRYVDAVLNSPNDIHRAIVADNEAIGCISLIRGQSIERYSAELGYWLTPRFWGKGIMAQAIEEICSIAYSQTELVRIQAKVISCNAASIRTLEKSGFTREGVLQRAACKGGVFYDLVLYARLK